MATVTPTALVVGGASGIGAACAAHLSADGWTVLIADRNTPTDVPHARAGLADVRDGQALADATAQLLDGEPLHGLVYAAGVARVSPLTEITPEQWRFIIDVNLNGAFHAVGAGLRHMQAGASIVLISSIDSLAPVSGLAHYCAAKAGLESLSRSVALEHGPLGVRCNVVAPGPVRTPLMNDVYRQPGMEQAFTGRTPLGSLAEPSQVADAVAYLLSDRASHLTGARIPVDGGMSLREHPSMLPTLERNQ